MPDSTRVRRLAPDQPTPAIDARQWLAAFALRLGVPSPTEAELDSVLALAGVAAHASERIAAPVACWLAARAGVEMDEAMAVAREVADG
jgi:hypothetical protein